MEEKKESVAKPCPWKKVHTVQHDGPSFRVILNESAQKEKEKELSGRVALHFVIGREVHSRNDDELERNGILIAR